MPHYSWYCQATLPNSAEAWLECWNEQRQNGLSSKVSPWLSPWRQPAKQRSKRNDFLYTRLWTPDKAGTRGWSFRGRRRKNENEFQPRAFVMRECAWISPQWLTTMTPQAPSMHEIRSHLKGLHQMFSAQHKNKTSASAASKIRQSKRKRFSSSFLTTSLLHFHDSMLMKHLQAIIMLCHNQLLVGRRCGMASAGAMVEWSLLFWMVPSMPVCPSTQRNASKH